MFNNIIHIPKLIARWENIYTNFKLKDHNCRKQIFEMPFLYNRHMHTAIQTIQNNSYDSTL